MIYIKSGDAPLNTLRAMLRAEKEAGEAFFSEAQFYLIGSEEAVKKNIEAWKFHRRDLERVEAWLNEAAEALYAARNSGKVGL